MTIDIHSHIQYSEGEYLIGELLLDMNKNQIDQRVISSINNENLLKNNQAIDDLCAFYPNQLIGCGVINPKLPDAIEQVQHAIGLPHIHFLEFDSFEHGYYPELQENLNEIFEIVKESNLIVKIFVGIGARAIPQQWEIYAQRFPEIPFIFLHMGCFDYGYTCIDVVKRNPNIYVETSNQYELQILRKAIHDLDAGKILFGTKYPERLTSSGLHVFDMLEVSEDFKKQVFGENAKELMRKADKKG